jgi:spermidine/putrescine transport system permease protein
MSATTIAAPAVTAKPWIGSDQVLRIAVGIYLALFFLYLFLPLVYMMLVTFNDSRIPTLTPWRGFTLRWFTAMWEDQRMWMAVWKSVVIGVSVIVLALPLGLAGAMFMTRMRVPGQSLVYAVLISPILMPGIIIGLSTLIFWDTQFRIGGRWQLSVLGQTSFIAAYCMLIFMARLTRFDQTLEEAALDLGATRTQVFRTVMVPYMRPAILSAAALAFLQSLENFNTTLFTIGNDITLTMYIAGKIRSGTTPALNALAFVMVVFTVIAGIAYELLRRREARAAAARARAAQEAELVVGVAD